MPTVRLNALVGAVHIQDPQPASGGLSVTAPAGSYTIFNCTWEVFQRIAPQIATLETAGVATYTVSGSTDNFWAEEGDLPGMPRIDVVSKHDLTLTGETGLTVSGYKLTGGQSFATTTLDYAAANTDLVISSRLPGYSGNVLNVEVIDSAGLGGLAVSLTGGDTCTVDLDGATPTATDIAAAINAESTLYLLFKATVDGTGGGTPTVKAAQALTGGEGPGMAVTCAGVACDIRTITTTSDPLHSMTVDVPDLTAASGAGKAVNFEVRTGGKVATIALQIAP
jgi:hypothetical protein